MSEATVLGHNWESLQRFLRSLDVDLTPKGFRDLGIYGLGRADNGDHVVVRSVTNGTEDVAWHHGIYLAIVPCNNSTLKPEKGDTQLSRPLQNCLA
jgi:hypothetical protein